MITVKIFTKMIVNGKVTSPTSGRAWFGYWRWVLLATFVVMILSAMVWVINVNNEAPEGYWKKHQLP